MIQKLPGDLGLDFGGGRGIAPDTGSANVQRACDVLKDLILGCFCSQLCPELRLTACSSLADSSDGGGDKLDLLSSRQRFCSSATSFSS